MFNICLSDEICTCIYHDFVMFDLIKKYKVTVLAHASNYIHPHVTWDLPLKMTKLPSCLWDPNVCQSLGLLLRGQKYSSPENI